MATNTHFVSISTGLLIASLAMPAFATNGYLPHGYSIRSQGMGVSELPCHRTRSQLPAIQPEWS